jgi:hypothetical protein
MKINWPRAILKSYLLEDNFFKNNYVPKEQRLKLFMFLKEKGVKVVPQERTMFPKEQRTIRVMLSQERPCSWGKKRFKLLIGAI